MNVSFDIFDTCIIRTCGTPDNFFEILSQKVFLEEVSECVRQEFIISRKKAEQYAAGISSKITISDIYNHFEFCHPLLLEKNKIKDIELELENALILPVLNTKKIIDQHRKEGNRILFISDMYLSSSFLIPILKQYGLFEEGDGIYISGEIGLCKYTGELFKYIQGKEKISYKEWVHYGDNLVSDIKEPHKLGIKTILLHYPYTQFSNDYLQNNTTTVFNYKNILLGLTRAISISEEEHPRKSLILEIIAPLYCSFLYNVFSTAHKKGITHLFFCARDTFQLYNMAAIMGELFPEIKIHYLIISRQALNESSSQDILNYFIQEGLASKEYKTAIVDITSSGKTIKTINKLLINSGFNPTFCFLLLKWDDPTVNSDTNVDDYNCIIRQDYIPKTRKVNYFLNSTTFTSIVESLFSSNTQKRVIKYQNNKNGTRPIFSDSFSTQDIEQKKIAQLELLHERLLTIYTKYWICLQLSNYNSITLNEIAIPYLIDFFFLPEKKYLNGVVDCKVKLNNEEIKKIIKKERLLKLLINKGKDSAWDRGTILYSLPDYLRKLFINNRILKPLDSHNKISQ